MSDIWKKSAPSSARKLPAAQRRMPLAEMRRDAESRVLTRDFVGAMRAKLARKTRRR